VSVKLAIFDCDGTLSDGQAGVCQAMDRAFHLAGLPAPVPAQVRRTVGLSLPQAVIQLAPDASDDQRHTAVEEYKQAFRAARMDGSLHEPMFPGVADLVRRLHASGWALGVATGKSDRGLRATLASNGLLDCFSTLQTADRHPSKPHPAMLLAAMDDVQALPDCTVMIGDTAYDMAAALAAGTHALGVGWGYHEASELLQAGASAIASSAAQLEEMLDAITTR
jgi:phosphoglycolate phosphatase